MNGGARHRPAAKISVEDGYLRLTPDPSHSFYFLAPDEKGVFAGRDQPLKLTFEKDDDGKVLGMTLEAGSRTYWFSRDD